MLVTTNQVFLATTFVDMRKSIHGLMFLVDQFFERHATDGSYYVFCNRKRDKIKILYWDHNGFALWYKRLEKSRFKIVFQEDHTVSLSANQLQWLLSGLDLQKVTGHPALSYNIFR